MDNDTTQQDAFIREVDDEYRRDQLARFWKRYGRWLLIAVGVGLALLAAGLFWREHQRSEAAKAGEQLMQAMGRLEVGDKAAQAEVRKLAEAGHKGYAVLARMAEAGAAARQGKVDEATRQYRAIAADDKVAQPLRDLALLRALRLGFDSMPTKDLITQLKPLAEPGNPWFAIAGDMLAAVYVRDNKPDMAAPLYAAIAKEEAAPPSTRARAGQMAEMLGAAPATAQQDQAK